MSIIQRLTDLAKANLNDLLDRAEDPVRTVRQIVRRLDDEIAALRGRVQAAEARVTRRRARLDEAVSLQDVWTSRAEEAVDAGNDAAARQALRSRLDAKNSAHELESAWWEACQERDDLAKQLLALENKAQEARRKKESLLLRRRQGESSSAFIAVPPVASQGASAEIEEELRRLKQEKETR